MLFISFMIMGTIISLSSTNWIYLWLGMELNLLSFIPVMSSSKLLQETEASMKYFLIQAIASGIMLTSGMMSINKMYFPYMEMLMSSMFLLSMTMKMGIAPFHQWLPHVMSSMPWSSCLLLSTWQKIGPMFLLMSIFPNNMSFMIIIMATYSVMIGGLGGMNQSQIRALLAYSSIGHMGWMLMALNCSFNIFLFYFLVYFIITSSLMILFINSSNLNTPSSNNITAMPTMLFMLIMMIMFSLGGMPPFIGFFSKWLIIEFLIMKNMMMIMFILIMGSLMNLFYYLNMIFNFMLINPQKMTMKMFTWSLSILIIMSSIFSPIIMFS
uniref:NADH-ubiquinone oxidoreductase chain 2 n=1 Tax=Laeonereis culveri TaxID=1859080 RepID=A0A1B0ZF36_9ANNE|nr:NADH dehydrogenase subunit 2 [Laeonereis culveri]